MKKWYSAVLTTVLCLALLIPTTAAAQSEEARPAMATNNAIVVSNSSEAPDAHLVHPAVYKIEGYNYFKLRDIAMLLRGSEKEFAVEYDEASRSVSILRGKPYTSIGGELTGAAEKTADAIPSDDPILIDGETAALTVFKIDGANYFKLRDLGKALDFHVGYNEDLKTVFISGARGYEEETDPDQ